jgi:hypothetical protein
VLIDDHAGSHRYSNVVGLLSGHYSGLREASETLRLVMCRTMFRK